MDAKAKIKAILKDRVLFKEKLLYIKTKTGELAKLKLNPPQQKLSAVIESQRAQKRPVRVIILKARQMGFSTYVEADNYQTVTTRRNTNSLIVAHKDDATNNLFNMCKLFWDMQPVDLRPMRKASNARELIFENPTKNAAEKKRNPGLRSKIKCATAGGDGVGRSDTLQSVHLSEYAFWPGDKKSTLSGILQSVPNTPDTTVIIESTANGFEHFEELWGQAVRGETDFIPVFFAWFEMPEYRMPAPYLELTEEEVKLKETYSLDNEQIAWRRWCIKNNCSGDVDQFKQEYPSCPEEAFLTTGRPVFDAEVVILRKKALEEAYRKEPPTLGNLECEYTDYSDPILDTMRFVEAANGWLTIYEEPKKGFPYVIGGDIAEGGLDFSVGQVLDNTTGNQVATWRAHTDTDIFAKQMFLLGHYYNKALVAIETNFDLHPVKELQRLGYYNQYKREVMDNISKTKQQKFGFNTSPANRGPIIGNLVALVRESIEVINDLDTLDEMLTFVRNSVGKPEAQGGKHDDCIMALAIAHYARGQQLDLAVTKRPKLAPDLPPDLKHDLERDPEALRHWLSEHPEYM
jgi:hypothetical protein